MNSSQSNESSSHQDHDDAAHHGPHAVPKRILLAVYFALCVLTVVTVAVAQIDLGALNIWVALFVAVVKASMVVLFFMHIWWDSPFNAVVLVAALFFVALFIGIALLDTKEYQPNLQAPELVTELTGEGANGGSGGSSDLDQPGLLTKSEADEAIAGDPSRGTKKISQLTYDQAVAGALADKGDRHLGLALFENVGCVKCHTIDQAAPLRAPCLADVTIRHPDPTYIFQSILQPSAYIAPGFEDNVFKIKSQQDPIEGFLASESDNTYSVRDTNGQITTFPKSFVTLHKVRAKSIMPEGLANDLTVHDLASIYAFLDSLSHPKPD